MHDAWSRSETNQLMAKLLTQLKSVPRTRRRSIAASLASVAFAGLGGCAVGPDFVSPPAPSVNRYTPEKIASIGGERLLIGSDIPQRWWEVFHNKNLGKLIEAAIAHNPSLQAAEAAIRISYYNAEAQKGGFLPWLQFDSNDSRNLQSGVQNVVTPNAPTNPYGLFLKQLSVTYTPDIWGSNRRAVESLEAQTDQARYQLEAAYLALTSNVAASAVQEAALRGQIAATREVIKEARDMLTILRKQYAIGAAAEADVLVQEAALAQMEQLLPPLERSLAQQRDLLTALAGQYSTAEVPETFNLRTLALPAGLPATLPGAFVRQRPDVRAAEANMHSASAQIGVAIAARLPNITLSATGGYTGYSLAQLFVPGSGFYTLAGSVAQPIFQGFSLLNKQKAAELGLTQAEAQYRQAVITAFQNVADALRALQADTKAVRAAVHAEVVARKSFEIVKKQFLMKEGSAVNMLQVLNAEQTWLAAASTRMAAEGQRLGDVVGLFMALGGGWKDQNLKNLPPSGPSGPTDEQTATIDGPVNPSWFPSFLDRESGDDRAPHPAMPAPTVPTAPAPPSTKDTIVPSAPAVTSGWMPSFLD
jgi:NodT family efflux transporter outer membrane factor (OMF) lipoprotein